MAKLSIWQWGELAIPVDPRASAMGPYLICQRALILPQPTECDVLVVHLVLYDVHGEADK